MMSIEDNETGFTPRTDAQVDVEGLSAKIAAVATQRKVRVVVEGASLHLAADDYEPVTRDANGNAIAGNYSIIIVPPGNAVELNEREAEKIVARHGGRILAADEKFEPAPGTLQPYAFNGDR